MIITYLYKCRRCGEIDRDKTSIPDKAGVFPSPRRLLLYAASGQKDTEIPALMSIHSCGGAPVGPLGVTDLVGCEPNILE